MGLRVLVFLGEFDLPEEDLAPVGDGGHQEVFAARELHLFSDLFGDDYVVGGAVGAHVALHEDAYALGPVAVAHRVPLGRIAFSFFRGFLFWHFLFTSFIIVISIITSSIIIIQAYKLYPETLQHPHHLAR